jgi:folate-binding protein YgfZ
MLDYHIIKVSGLDSLAFLQGLITNDINKLEDNMVYNAMLTSKGRYIFDFFVIQKNGCYYLVIDKVFLDSLVKKLNFYKLASKVIIETIDNYVVLQAKQLFDTSNLLDINIYKDPRLPELGYKIITTKDNLEHISKENILSQQEYQNLCFSLGVLEGSNLPQNIIPIEFGLDELNAISYTKGCYLGQELTNSAKNRLAIRKKLIIINISNLSNSQRSKIVVNGIVFSIKNEEIGYIVAVNALYAICLVKMSGILDNAVKPFKPHQIIIEGAEFNIEVPYYINDFILD